MRVDREESDRPDQQNLFPPEIKADRCSVWECLHISTVCKLKFILFKLINLSEINERYFHRVILRPPVLSSHLWGSH